MYIEHKNILLAHERNSKYKDKYKYCILKSAFSDPLLPDEPLEYTNKTVLTNKSYKEYLLTFFEVKTYTILNEYTDITMTEKIKSLLNIYLIRNNTIELDIFAPYNKKLNNKTSE